MSYQLNTKSLLDLCSDSNISYTEVYDEVYHGLFPHDSQLPEELREIISGRKKKTSRSEQMPFGRSSDSDGNLAISSVQRNASRQQRNREAQRAFRKRKEQQLQELEEKIRQLEADYRKIKEERDELYITLSIVVNGDVPKESLEWTQDALPMFSFELEPSI